MQTCGTCRFFKNGGHGGGHCRRYPPSFMMEQIDPPDRMILVSGWYHPFVENSSWCGEWLRDRPLHSVKETV